MDQAPPMRVVVGVNDSLAGLRALRIAVAEARRRRATLHAVRVMTTPAGPGPAGAYRDELYRAGEHSVRRAFTDALGGLPGDIPVEIVVLLGPAGRSLTDYAYRDDDLLVVGTGQHRRRPFTHRIARFVVSHAACPVLAVPPQELARLASTRTMTRELWREVRRLTDAGPGPR